MSDEADWLAWRAQGLGGSDVASVLGVSPWGSPYSLWVEKVGLGKDRGDATEAQEFGLRAEPMLADWFRDKTGLFVLGEQRQCVHPTKPWMRCTIDGMVYEHVDRRGFTGDPLGVYEAKTTGDSPETWAEAVPVYYACQATWNMLVTGTNVCWFAVLHMAFGRVKFRTYEFHLDPSDAVFVEEACERFWLDHVVTGTPPAVDGSDATTDALTAMWDTAAGGIEASAELEAMLAQRDQWKQTADLATAELDRLANEVRLALGDAEVLVDTTGKKLASWKWQTAERVDLKSLRAEQPEIAAKYMTESRSRVLRFTKEK